VTVALHAIENRLKQLHLGDRLIRRNPIYYSSVRREFSRVAAAGFDERRAWLEARVERTLCAAARTPYGKGLRAPMTLQQWPLLCKEDVRDNPRLFTQAGLWGRWGTTQAATGGTTGMPLKLVRTPECVVAEEICRDVALAALGLHPGRTRIAVLRADSIKDPSDMRPPFWIYTLGGRRLILSTNHLNERTLTEYVAALRSFSPDLLWVYPTALASLCLLLQAANERLHIPRVLSSSEMLSPEIWRLARAMLGCAIVDRYGQAERVACANAFAPGVHWFVPSYAYVELIPHSQHESMRLYEIVGTSLWNSAMPLVRYRTGDLICAPASYGARELQELALGMRSFEGVIGRAHDVLAAPDGQGVLTGLNHIPRNVENLLSLQVVQESLDRIVLRVLPTAAFSDADACQLMRNARLKIPTSIDVQIEIVDALERTDHGKTPFVVHGPAVRDALDRFGFQLAMR
jgi:phenylacetate-coenzyme A ligase PaaK-like adenylate-forming protein